MAIDPRIPLGVQVAHVPARMPDPFERAVKIMSLRDMMDRTRIREMQMEEARRKAEEEQRQIEAARRYSQLLTRRRASVAEAPDLAGNATAAIEAGYGPELAAPLLNAPPDAQGAGPAWPTQSEVFEAAGAYAPELWEKQVKAQKEERLAEEARLKQAAEKAMALANIAQGIKTGNSPYAMSKGILLALQNGLIDTRQAHSFMTRRPDSPETAATLDLMIAQGNKAYDQTKELREQRKFEAELPGVEAEAAKKISDADLAEIRQTGMRLAAASSKGPDAFTAELSRARPEVARIFKSATSPYEVMQRALDPQQAVQNYLAEFGALKPRPGEVQQQRIDEATAMAGGRANVLLSPEKMRQDLEIKRQELRLQAEANIAKAMSGESAKVLSIATNIQPGLEQLRQAFRKDYKGTLRAILFGTDRELSKLAENVADQVGRLRSGGAVNKDEEARFIGQIAQAGDLAFGNVKAAEDAIDRYIAEAKSMEGLMRPQGGVAPPTVTPPAGGGKKPTKKFNPVTGKVEDI